MNGINNQSSIRSEASIERAPRRLRLRSAVIALAVGCALPCIVGTAPAMAKFGIASFSNTVIKQNGKPATQAGSHPWEAVTSMTFTARKNGLPTENVKNVVVKLPPGLIGNPTSAPRCEISELDVGACPVDSQIGTLGLTILGGSSPTVEPLYNLVPPQGEPAEFGANILLVNSYLDISVRTGSDYGLTVTTSHIPTLLPINGITVTLWGVPADPSHDADRVCPSGASPCSSSGPLTPFLTDPTSCTGPLTASLTTDSWQHGKNVTATSQSPGMKGCNREQFNPSFTAQPDTKVADSPMGLDTDLHVPQAPPNPNGVATPDVKKAVVDLPAGVSINPSAANGLKACTQQQFGLRQRQRAHVPECVEDRVCGDRFADPERSPGGVDLARSAEEQPVRVVARDLRGHRVRRGAD